MTGERTGEIILVYQHLEGYLDPKTLDETMFAPDYVSPGHVFVPGMAMERWTSVEVDEGGTTMMVKYSFEARSPDGTLVAFLEDLDMTGTRLVPATTGTPTA